MTVSEMNIVDFLSTSPDNVLSIKREDLLKAVPHIIKLMNESGKFDKEFNIGNLLSVVDKYHTFGIRFDVNVLIHAKDQYRLSYSGIDFYNEDIMYTIKELNINDLVFDEPLKMKNTFQLS